MAPFKDPIVNTDFLGNDEFHIKTFPVLLSNPPNIIRRISIHQNEENGLKRILIAQDAFNEFREYGLLVPCFQVIKTRLASEIDPNYYIITELITGLSLPMLEVTQQNTLEVQAEISKYLISLINYCQKKYLSKSYYPTDLLPHQLVYGKDSKGILGIYWVDLDPLIQWINPDIPDSVTFFLEKYLGFIVVRILDFEERCNARLSLVRDLLKSFAEEIEQNSLFTEELIKTLHYLD